MIPAILLVGLLTVLIAANTRNRVRGVRNLPPIPEEAPATPRTIATPAAAPRSRPVVPVGTKLEVLIGLSVSPLEKVFMSTDNMEAQLVSFTTDSTRRLNRLGYRGRFAHPRVSYSDRDYGFRIMVNLDYGSTLTPEELALFQGHVGGFITGNDTLRPRLLFVSARKV